MASRIEPGSSPKPATPPAKASVPKPVASPSAAKAGAAKPTSAAAAPQAAKPAPQPASTEHDGEDREGARSMGGMLKLAPAWAVSMLVHIIALLGMALMVTPPPEKEQIRVITSSTAEAEEEFEEFSEQEEIVENQQTEVADVVVPTDVAVVTDVNVVTQTDDVEAAPLAVELTDFGSQTAPASDMMASIGAVGGTGSGLGPRSNAAAVAAQRGGGIDTEAAVDRALKWFIQHQMPDGGWSFNLKKCPNCAGKCSHGVEGGHAEDRCAATAMAMLPFLGRGYTHKEGPYKRELEAGIAFLAGLALKGKGQVYGPGGNLYSQGLAGIALSESYAMTQDPRLQAPTQLALNFIMDAQNPANGGWQYQPKRGGDTSVVGWQLMALKSGHMAYLPINPLTIKKAVEFLDSVQDDDGACYGYIGPGKGIGTSAVGLLCRMYLGWKKENPALQRGVERLAKIGPQPNLYFDYYATQIMHHMEGDIWLAWNEKMKKMLLSTQATKGHEAGSWYEGWEAGASSAGRVYTTALSTMILEVYYRHLPIYRNQSVEAEFRE